MSTKIIMLNSSVKFAERQKLTAGYCELTKRNLRYTHNGSWYVSTWYCNTHKVWLRSSMFYHPHVHVGTTTMIEDFKDGKRNLVPMVVCSRCGARIPKQPDNCTTWIEAPLLTQKMLKVTMKRIDNRCDQHHRTYRLWNVQNYNDDEYLGRRLTELFQLDLPCGHDRSFQSGTVNCRKCFGMKN